VESSSHRSVNSRIGNPNRSALSQALNVIPNGQAWVHGVAFVHCTRSLRDRALQAEG
jgi:hypothetical protein